MSEPEKIFSSRVMYALIFDKASGEDSLGGIKAASGEQAENVVGVHWDLPPRVDGEDLVTGEKKDAVVEGIADAVELIVNTYPDEQVNFTNTCNTASLGYFMGDVDAELTRRGVEKSRYRFHSLLGALATQDQAQTMTVGTRALCQGLLMENSELKTPLTYEPPEGVQFPTEEREKLARLFQELVWREKQKDGSDVSGASAYPDFEGEANKVKIAAAMEEAIESLVRLKVKRVNLACTEAPLFFAGYEKRLEDEGISLVDPSRVLGQQWRDEKRDRGNNPSKIWCI